MTRRGATPAHPRRAAAAVVLAAVVAGALRAVVACGDHSDTAVGVKAGADAPTSETGSEARDPNANCVKPGTPNNDQGLGGYCESNDDCVRLKSLCTAEFHAPPNAWFCTRPCDSDPDCGVGLYCADDPRGIACVPIVCGVADAATDAPND